jgi:AcrR family transcriptional regulator
VSKEIVLAEPTATRASRRRTQSERTEATRKQLARAAFERIRDHGYANFRVAGVAAHAGVSLGGQLHHFPTKDAVTMAAIDFAIGLAKERTDANLAAFKMGVDPVEAIIEDCRDYYFSASFDVAMDVTKSASGDPELRRQIARAHRDFRSYAEDGWVERLVDAGWDELQARDLIAMTGSLVRGFAIRAMIRRDQKQFERLMTTWREMVALYFGDERSR